MEDDRSPRIELTTFSAASARHGYADQAHLARAVRRYAGETASAFAAARRPTAWTAIGLA